MSISREVGAGKAAIFRVGSKGIGQPAVLVENETALDVTVTVAEGRQAHGETDEYLTLRINTTLVSSLDAIAAILHDAAEKVAAGITDDAGPLCDSAGNEVGSYRIGPAS